MLIDHLLILDIRLSDDGLGTLLGIGQDRVLVGQNLLVALDLLRGLHPKFPQQLFKPAPVHDDSVPGSKQRALTGVDIIFDLFNDLFNTTVAHLFHTPFRCSVLP